MNSKKFQLEQAYNTNGIAGSSRSDLQQSSNSSRLWENNDDDDDDNFLEQFNQKKPTTTQRQTSEILQEQNEALESLSHLISRQKDIAIKIGDEVDVQNGIQ